jgi:hypothetical protein
MLTPYLPYGLVIEPTPTGTFVILEPPERCLAGQLTLPYLSERRLAFVDVFIPSNGRFTQGDLRLLWTTGAELAIWRAARLALVRPEGDFGHPEVVGSSPLVRDWRSLTTCAHDAASLLNRWPTRLDQRMTWLPVSVPGGTEDLPLTEQQVQRRGYMVELGSTWVVTQSARWMGQRRPLKSPTVSALALAVVQLAHASVPAEQLPIVRPLLDPLAMVSRIAAAPVGYRDPDPSSWPVAFTAFAASCMATLAELQSFRRGEGVVPLLDTDELYEAWLAVQVRAALDNRLGTWRVPTSEALAAWDHDDAVYELWLKPGIGSDGRLIGNESFQAVVAELLTPDLVLSATRGDVTELMVLDAKAWAEMSPEGALTQSSKYLYGIRRTTDMRTVPALAGIDLVTCARPPTISSGDLAKVAINSATPTVGIEALHSRISSIVDQLMASLAERERYASAS